jgi:dienelactone hydrolase
MIEQTLDIETEAGAMETFTCHPDRGKHPAVFLLMDAPGIREELRDKARLGTVGYYVLLPTCITAPAATRSMDRMCLSTAVPSISGCAPAHQDDHTAGDGRHRRDAGVHRSPG